MHPTQPLREANALLALRNAITQDGSEKPILGQATPLNNDPNDAVEPWVQWTLFTLGILLGGLVEFVANWDEWPCLSDIASLLESAYLIYFYIASYIETGDGEDIAYATLYLVKGFETGFDIRCGAGDEFQASYKDYFYDIKSLNYKSHLPEETRLLSSKS